MAKMPHGPFRLVEGRETEDIVKQEMFTEIGRIVVHLSNVENSLADLFYLLLGHRVPDWQRAIELFYAQSVDNKIALIDLLMHLEGPEEELTVWKKIADELRSHRAVRNLVAHQGMSVNFFHAEGRVAVALDPAPLRTKFDPKTKHIVPSKGRRVELAEIRSTASALERIRSELKKLWTRIEDRSLPEELRSNYVEPDEND
jgi:hypothetical protein